jgi:triosephosphate isomerase
VLFRSNNKAKALLSAGIKPIVCVGEMIEERKSGKAFDVVKDHVINSLAGLTKVDMQNVVLAYEPVWAIGTGLTATKEEAQEIHGFIRGLLVKIFDDTTAKSVRIQYGGSVKAENVLELISQQDVDGALVGGASLKADIFSKIVRFKEI